MILLDLFRPLLFAIPTPEVYTRFLIIVDVEIGMLIVISAVTTSASFCLW